LQQTVQPPDHRPVEPAEDRLRVMRLQLGHASRAASPVGGCAASRA
jgi:hypothetical protein